MRGAKEQIHEDEDQEREAITQSHHGNSVEADAAAHRRGRRLFHLLDEEGQLECESNSEGNDAVSSSIIVLFCLGTDEMHGL